MVFSITVSKIFPNSQIIIPLSGIISIINLRLIIYLITCSSTKINSNIMMNLILVFCCI